METEGLWEFVVRIKDFALNFLVQYLKLVDQTEKTVIS